MKHDPKHLDTSPNDTDGVPVGVEDSELEVLLQQAYPVPPVPQSLLKKIDQGIEAEWGTSPQLITRRGAPITGALSKGRRWMKTVPVAAIAALVVMAIMLSQDGRAYAWATMLEAMAEHGLIERQTATDTRWLSLADGLVGQRTNGSSRLLNLADGVLLEHQQGSVQVHRRILSSQLSADDENAIVLGYFMSDGVDTRQWERFAGARVVEESWEDVPTQDAQGRDQIILHVEFKLPDAGSQELALTLDAETHLPVAFRDAATSEVAHINGKLTYPQQSLALWRNDVLPPELPVIDIESAESFTDPATMAANGVDGREVVAVTPDNLTKEDEDHQTILSAEVALLGAANRWQPVMVVDRSTPEAVVSIDNILQQHWAEQGITPAPPADDAELLRRVYLDLAGRTPIVNEVRDYLKDTSDDRYERLVDRLLSSPDHASHLAAVWRSFLIPEGVDLTAFGGIEAFDRWLADRFASGDSYDKVARSLLLAEGRLSRSGPLLFYSATKLDPEQLAARTARVFLGMRLECAQCHDHPFEPWTQQDFWGFAAFFTQISRPQGELENVSTVMRVHDVDRGEAMLPDTDTVIPPSFLGHEISVDADDDKEKSRRQKLAHWLTSSENAYFPRATANRVWWQMFGKGIVDPVDDFGEMNTPKSPALLEALASHFIATDFNLQELFRVVALSDAYRLSSGAPTQSDERVEWFAQMNVKTLTAEQVYDCITVATMLDGADTMSTGFNLNRYGNSDRDIFLQQFRTPAGRSTEYMGGIPQALTLMNGGLISGATGLSTSGLLKSLEAPFFTNEQRIEVLYMATLSRRPRPTEWELLKAYVPDDAEGATLQEGLADLLWALLNSAEFTMNH